MPTSTSTNPHPPRHLPTRDDGVGLICFFALCRAATPSYVLPRECFENAKRIAQLGRPHRGAFGHISQTFDPGRETRTRLTTGHSTHTDTSPGYCYRRSVPSRPWEGRSLWTGDKLHCPPSPPNPTNEPVIEVKTNVGSRCDHVLLRILLQFFSQRPTRGTGTRVLRRARC